MKKLIALMLLMAMFTVGCDSIKVKPVDVGGGPGIAVVISEKDKERFDEGMSKFENVVDKINDALPVIATLAKVAGEISDDEDFDKGADDVADAAEKGAAGLGVLMAVGMLLKNIVKKEDS